MGVLVGLWISVRNSERLGYDGDKAWNLGILVVLCGIIGAKVLYVINEWGYYSTNPKEIFSVNTLQAGGVFSGGLLAAFAAAAWYVWKHDMPALGTCDAFAPGLALGHAIGRRRLLRRRMLLRQRDASLVGRRLPQSAGELDYRHAAECSTRADAVVRVGGRARKFFLPDVAAQAPQIRRPGHRRVHVHLRHRALPSGVHPR